MVEAVIEISPQILIGDVSFQDEIGCAMHVRCDGKNGLLGASTGPQTEVAGSEVTVFLMMAPMRLGEHRLEPGGSFLDLRIFPGQSALIHFRAETRPENQIADLR